MADANKKRKLVRFLPSEKLVTRWVEHAKKLPLKITYRLSSRRQSLPPVGAQPAALDTPPRERRKATAMTLARPIRRFRTRPKPPHRTCWRGCWRSAGRS